jgi:subtilase family serine protease
MRQLIRSVAVSAALSVLLGNAVVAQSGRHKGSVVIPSSSMERSRDAGERAHTNIQLFIPARGLTSPRPLTVGPPYSGYMYETPASVACVYRLATAAAGCNPNTVMTNSSGGSRAIAIVDAYDDPNAASDLARFSSQFGLPAPNFQVVYASGTQPSRDFGWELEESLDIEWAHAVAPNAKIYLVEAASNSYSDLFLAVSRASSLVADAGGGEVSMSWGSGEFPGETGYDSYFTTPGVVYFASAGDGPGTLYPSVSPNVVAAGGTTLRRNPSTGAFRAEAAWVDTGGGTSFYEARPGYQSSISTIVGSRRGVPDLSAVADPNTGVWVYDSGNGGWWIVGGTSASAPILAGIVNRAGHFAPSTSSELTTIYSNMALAADFRDTTTGFCGPYMGYSTARGWDFCTGVGSPYGLAGK